MKKHGIIYLSAPYTKGDVAQNINRVIYTANHLLEMGYIPYIPHLNHLWHLITPHPSEVWMQIDLALLARCDALLRLDGESNGADIEVNTAKIIGMPIYYSLGEVK